MLRRSDTKHGKDKNAYVWMEAKKYIDANENTAIITLHNEKIVQNTVIRMEQELVKKEQDMAKQYWDMVSLLTTVLNHNQLVESGYQDDISFYTKQVYLQLQKNYPEYGITDEERECFYRIISKIKNNMEKNRRKDG